MAAEVSSIGIRLSVCICTRDRTDELLRTLESIEGSSVPVHQVVVSDDGTDGRTAALVAARAPIELVEGPREGLAANRNEALRHVDGTHVLFLDDDCRLARNFVATVSEALAHIDPARSDRFIVTGNELNRGSVVTPGEQTFLGFQARAPTKYHALRAIVINSTVFPATLFAALTFDRKLRYGYEEADIAIRASAAGYDIVWLPEAMNVHEPSEAGRGDYAAYAEASRLYVTLRRYFKVDRRPLVGAAYAVFAPVHLIAASVRRHGLGGVRLALSICRSAAGYWRADSRPSS
jgi:glycosyltransferase involved in cell wall biosynthesis